MTWLDDTDSGARTTYRARALQWYGAWCNFCGYNKEVKMLDVDHINSNRKDGRIENLQVLCVWCHATKTRRVKLHSWDGSLPEEKYIRNPYLNKIGENNSDVENDV